MTPNDKTDRLRALLVQMDQGPVKMTPHGFIDDADTWFFGEHFEDPETADFLLGEKPLSFGNHIRLPDGSIFYIEARGKAGQ